VRREERRGDEGRGGKRRGGEGWKRRGPPKGWFTPPMFKILKNTLDVGSFVWHRPIYPKHPSHNTVMQKKATILSKQRKA